MSCVVPEEEEVVVSSEVQVGASSTEYWWWQEDPFLASIDGDGDLEVPRRRKKSVVVEHASGATSLSRVGLQVWRGALVLCDWLLSTEIKGLKVLELGSGTGLAALVASRQGAQVTATDGIDDILKLAKQNVRRNGAAIRIEKLDWLTFDEKDDDDLKGESFDLILAADCVYDDDLTEALFEVLRHYLRHDAAVAVVSLELRFNFEVESLSVQAHGYRRFRDLSDTFFEATRLHLPAQRLQQYHRHGATFELWQLTTKTK